MTAAAVMARLDAIPVPSLMEGPHAMIGDPYATPLPGSYGYPTMQRKAIVAG